MALKFKRRILVALGWNSPRIHRAIGKCALEAGWHLDTRHFFTETIPEVQCLEGLIVSHSQRPDLDAFMRRQAPLQPTVLIGGINPGIDAPQVTEDNVAIGALAARHFIERGHRHFAWFSPVIAQVATDRCEGFRRALAAAGFDCHILEPCTDHPVGDWLAKRLRALPRPLAFFALDDQVASDVIELCIEQKWRVPEEIAILGVGNIEIACECSHVPISSVEVNEERIGWQAAMLLDKLMRGRKAPAKPLVVAPGQVIVRRSTDFRVLTDPALGKAVEYITANLHRPISFDQVAIEAGISRRTLYSRFQTEMRRKPAQFILQARLERARSLLSKPDAKVDDIVAKCGLGSLRTLTRLFLKYEKMTPRAWQKANSQAGMD